MYPAFAVFERILAKKILLILSIPVLSLTTRADSVVVDTFGPGDTYDQSGGYVVGNPNIEIAAQFNAGASGNLTNVALGLLYVTQGPVNVYLYGDASGLPDNVNQTFLGSGTPTVHVGGVNNSVVSFSIASTIAVTTGTTYWLVVKPATTSMFDVWQHSNPGVFGPLAGSFDDGSTWEFGEVTILPAFRLTASTPAPPYAAQIQQPINQDGTSVFNVRRGVIPVKFTLTQDGVATCALPSATIVVTRTAGGNTGPVDESIYTGSADTGLNFRIDNCQYIYNLSASALGVGTYRVDIKINGHVVGSATFQLK